MAILDRATKSLKFGTEISVKMESYLSGHLYAHSSMETSDSCGNCDGGRCDSCEKTFTVTVSILLPAKLTGNLYDEFKPISWTRFYDQDEAKAYYQKQVEHYNSL